MWTQDIFLFIYFFQKCFVIFSVWFSSPWLGLVSIFILFDAIVNETVFLLSFLDYLLSVYRNAADFYMLILCSAVLLNLFISHSNFWYLVSFISFSCFVALAKTSKITLNRGGKSGHSCHISDHRGKARGLSSLSMMLTVDFHIWSLLCWGDFF